MSRDEIRALLQGVGLRATPGRIAVYSHLRSASTPLTHAEVVTAVQELGLDPATIYRNLTDLSEAGLISRSDLGDHVWRFELLSQDAAQSDHPHFVCTDCGTVRCLNGLQVNFSKVRRAPRSLGKKQVEVQIRGLCDHCA